ncbi:hypothetical protein [Tessaracoccus oleiagri]|uniref:Cell division protein FtsL n=1 Tax=Tessaracoccus oleiagri TaxID=686624 RepID=A0A1G9L210_9ACTN|nr:hypothetical protein [Tessaracoccus oleiagri]SDL56018.1 hypothetical protein SAMN04488242_1958 [Tessaracoccus oleiagri]
MSEMTNRPRAGVSTVGFVLIVLAIVGLGLGGVMVVTTSIGAQSRELSALRNRADDLAYESAALGTQLETLSSTASLALRATDLGMVPNPYPAFVSLADGKILGTPTPVEGDELPQLRGRLPKVTDVPAQQPPAPPSESPQLPGEAPTEPVQNPDDVVAADQVGGRG